MNVRLYTTMHQTELGREFGTKLREAVAHALEDERHTVEIVWDSLA